MTKNDGGPAYPTHPDCPTSPAGWIGLSLRDYFAAAALTGLIAENAHEQSTGSWDLVSEHCAKAYEFSDAMLKEREK